MAKNVPVIRNAGPLLAVGTQLGELLVAVAAYCVVVGYIVKLKGIQPVEWGTEAALLNGVILGLLYGFRNRAAYDRWWEGRRLWGQLVNDSRNLAIKLAAYVKTVDPTPAGRLIVGFADALNRHLRGLAPKLTDVPGFEKESDNPAHVPIYLAGRLIQLTDRWRDEKHLTDTSLWLLDPHLRGLLDVCGACERIRNTPLPASYKGMLRCGLGLNIVIAPWFAMAHFGYWGLPVLLLTAFFLLGVELIDSSIEEPFGNDRDDLDLDRYCGTIRDSVEQVLPPRPESTSNIVAK